MCADPSCRVNEAHFFLLRGLCRPGRFSAHALDVLQIIVPLDTSTAAIFVPQPQRFPAPAAKSLHSQDRGCFLRADLTLVNQLVFLFVGSLSIAILPSPSSFFRTCIRPATPSKPFPSCHRAIVPLIQCTHSKTDVELHDELNNNVQ